ncbi:MAG: prepilin-type N-terminal cleavage/methylation domain-containing protein [Oligoflexia bacterium]|nr:prepilin-type N-terminal cleavage/methylation domain-containing protein [Oligoflexia bacterium]
MSSRSRNRSGFTLLEVLIALAILVFISLGIYQATVETYRLRDILSTEGDFYNQIRLSMEIMQKDLAAMYSPGLMAPAPSPSPGIPAPGSGGFGVPAAPDAESQTLLSGELGQTSEFWLPATDKTGLRNSRFKGTETKMSFITLSHQRIYKDSPESDFSKVTYELLRDENNRDAETLVLVKTENAEAFNTDDQREKEKSRSFFLLPGITKARFRYLRKNKEEWKEYSAWDNASEDFKNAYPDLIEVSLSVKGPSRLTFEGVFKLRPEVPLRGINPSH